MPNRLSDLLEKSPFNSRMWAVENHHYLCFATATENSIMEQNVTIALTHRLARLADVPLLAQMNHQLIRDEGHENPMTLPELGARMKRWLQSECRGVLFEHERNVVAYALYRSD